MPVEVPPPTTPDQAEVRVLGEARAVRDCGMLDFSKFFDKREPVWVVLHVTPQGNSGAATIPGAFVNGDTGEVVEPPNARLSTIKEGTWKRGPQQGATWPADGKYQWTEPIEDDKRVLEPEDIYSPFISGGTILFTPVLGREGIQQFGSIGMIFPRWADAVFSAIESAQTEQALTATTPPAGTQEQLLSLTQSKNPFVSSVAFHKLVSQAGISPKVANSQIGAAPDELRAVLVFILLEASPKGSAQETIDGLSALVDAATDSKDLQPVALGAHAAKWFAGSNPAARERGDSLLNHVKKRIQDVKIRVTPDSTLAVIVR